MASRDPISDDPGRPAPDEPLRPAPGDRQLPRLEYRPPPGTLEKGRGRVFWAVIAFFIALIIVGLLFWSGIVQA